MERGWTRFGHVRLLHPSGIGIAVYQINTHERLTVGGIFPGVGSALSSDTITLGTHRPPERLARDIIRRVLPGYLAKIGEALEEAAEAERHRQARVVMNERLTQVLPNISRGHISPHEATDRKRSYWPGGVRSLDPRPAIAQGEVKLSTDAQSMDIKMSEVPTALALRILALLDPRDALEGRVMPHAVSPAPRELAPAPRTIVGQVVARSPGRNRHQATLPEAGNHTNLENAPLPQRASTPHPQ
ncbi:hypothetical protein [Streptomyces sp. NBC_01304]|uniref:hypothetical protein n=1 Tax=Streptomyces sp. NBC_01304 TaxID=2903818 RepID=UPI002E0D4B2D|nr:hypothetical protein OG430_47815 [Streptomyces sp. NBC_01304]